MYIVYGYTISILSVLRVVYLSFANIKRELRNIVNNTNIIHEHEKQIFLGIQNEIKL